jgi:hypothetical protein
MRRQLWGVVVVVVEPTEIVVDDDKDEDVDSETRHRRFHSKRRFAASL